VSLLPDINVWLALTFSAHSHHAQAKAWFETTPSSSCAFCRMTQQGFLRLCSNPAIFKSDALNLRQAWKAYDALQGDHRVYFELEPVGIEDAWRRLTNLQAHSPKKWNDAYLAAFSEKAELRLVSFDRGFKDFKDLRLKILS